MVAESPYHYPAAASPVMSALHATLRSFPIACFTLALVFDIAYVQTANLLWLHFAEWLLFAGLVAGVAAILLAGIEFLVRRVRPSWYAVLAASIVLMLAAINNFVHTADGWTAVMPFGLTLSILTVLGMIVTAVLTLRGVHHG